MAIRNNGNPPILTLTRNKVKTKGSKRLASTFTNLVATFNSLIKIYSVKSYNVQESDTHEKNSIFNVLFIGRIKESVVISH